MDLNEWKDLIISKTYFGKILTDKKVISLLSEELLVLRKFSTILLGVSRSVCITEKNFVKVEDKGRGQI
jgi:hypothetical protein